MGKASKRKKLRREQAQNGEPAEEKPKPKFWQHNWFKIGLIVCLVIALGITAYSLTGRDSELMDKPVVAIEMENGDEIKMQLEPGVAPNTVNNFISLVKDGFYDGLIFHRVIPGFMIQGGCPDGTGMGGPGYNIKGEFSSNGFENNLQHTRGVVSMARSQAPDSAGSQFFIVVEDSHNLDGDYAAFGRVIEGMDVADRIVSVDRDESDKPDEDQVMKKVTVDTFGIKYDEPEKVEE